MFKRYHLIVAGIGALLVFFLVGFGQAQQDQKIESTEKSEKSTMKITSVASTDLIGVFPPGFQSEATIAQSEYSKAHGIENVLRIKYKGYILIMPKSKSNDLELVKKKIDRQIADQSAHVPPTEQQEIDVKAIQDLFGTQGTITFDPVIGAYTDEKGYQYTFWKGEIVGKQIGVTSTLRSKWESAHPYLTTPGVSSFTFTKVALSDLEAQEIADRIVNKTSSSSNALNSRSSARVMQLGEFRTGIDYGQVQILIDKVTGEVIHYSVNVE